MNRNPILAWTVLAVAGCGSEGRNGAAYDPLADFGSDGTGGSSDGLPPADATSDGDTGTGEPGVDPDGVDPDAGDSGGEETTEGTEPIDCTPAWPTPWIGSPCQADGDCAFDGGQCLQPSDGFPCGTCTQACTMHCPDIEGAPVTYCINGTDVALPDAGHCLSKCDAMLLPGEGCRDGYVCNVLSRFDGTGAAGVCIPEEFGTPEGGMYVEEIDHAFLIDFLGGDPVDALAYGPDLDSFQMYLDAVGVQHTTAAEIVEPYNMAAAVECGFSILLPGNEHWEKIGALALFTDELIELVGEPVFMRNWWRPPCYNAAVGGAAGGDHPDADAVDLDFMSADSRALAQQFLCNTYWNEDIVTPDQIAPGSDLDPRLNMSVGLGGVTIHLGVLSQGGRRFWMYGSYTEEPDSGDCW